MCPPPSDKPSTAQAYASLRAASQEGESNGETPPATPCPADEQSYWRREIEQLEAMKQALWEGFIAAPQNGVPTELAEYISTMVAVDRLKLKLMGHSAWPSRTLRGPVQATKKRWP